MEKVQAKRRITMLGEAIRQVKRKLTASPNRRRIPLSTKVSRRL